MGGHRLREVVGEIFHDISACPLPAAQKRDEVGIADPNFVSSVTPIFAGFGTSIGSFKGGMFSQVSEAISIHERSCFFFGTRIPQCPGAIVMSLHELASGRGGR